MEAPSVKVDAPTSTTLRIVPLKFEAPDVSAFEASLAPIAQRAKSLVVDSRESHEVALKLDQEAALAIKLVDDELGPAIKAQDYAHKTLTGLRTRLQAGSKLARVTLSQKVIAYEDKARRAAEEERQRQVAAARVAEEDRALADAQEAADSGDHQLAEEIITAPIPTAAVQVAPELAKVSGSSTRSTWKAELVNFAALVAYVAKHPEWMNLLSPNQSALDQIANAQKSQLAIPGVRAKEFRSLASKAAPRT